MGSPCKWLTAGLRMRIAIDAHAIGSALTGNERYIENIAQQLLCMDKESEYFFFFTSEDARRTWQNRAQNLTTCLVARNPWLRLSIDLPRQMRQIRPDVFHYQYTGPLFQLCPEVVTIHDLSFERYPEFYSPVERYRLKLTVPQAARRAKKIITGSNFARDEIVDLYGIGREKIDVIYHGVSQEFERPDLEVIEIQLQRYSIRQPYLLAVGNISRRKNHVAIVRGFHRWLQAHPSSEYQLVFAGKAQDAAADVMHEAAELGLLATRLKILGYVPEFDLPYIYAGAALLLNTSIYEGFGLPLIEAMRAGVPVIASRASCFPEVTEDAALLVDPRYPEEIAEAIDKVLNNSAMREQLICRGLQRAQMFRWDTAARKTLRVYHEAVETNRAENA
jgi:glycosyltransferase involved in cell wall biosynthesis